jgi:hypothetical protein
MQGYSGSYAINGVKILQPTRHQWVDMEILGIDGNGRPIYPQIGEFQLEWGLMSVSDLNLLISFANFSLTTGTCVVDLPKWGDNDYLFYSYSGTYISRPVVGSYFSENVEDVSIIVRNIRV